MSDNKLIVIEVIIKGGVFQGAISNDPDRANELIELRVRDEDNIAAGDPDQAYVETVVAGELSACS